MTNSIGSLPGGQISNTPASDTQPGVAAGQVGSAPPAQNAASQSGEAVTVSTDAHSTAQLLSAARSADGVDMSRVSQLRSTIQSGAYNVSPNDVAKAIAGAAITGAGLGGAS